MFIFRDKNNDITGYSKFRVTEDQDEITIDSPEWLQYVTDFFVAETKEKERMDGYAREQATSDLMNLTIEQAKTWIDNKLDNADTAQKKIEAIRVIFHKMAGFLL